MTHQLPIEGLSPEQQAIFDEITANVTAPSEHDFANWMSNSPLAQAIITGDRELALQLAKRAPAYIKQRLTAYLDANVPKNCTPIELRNEARRLDIKQKKLRAKGKLKGLYDIALDAAKGIING